LVYTIPHDTRTGAARPSFRAIRFLTPLFAIALANLPGDGGVVLQGLRLPSPKNDKARLAVAANLPRSMSKGTGMAVRNLSLPPTPPAKLGDTQFVIAVAGRDGSIAVFTLEQKSVHSVDMLYDLLPVRIIKEVHPLITDLAFSVFTPPKTTGRPQFIKLASVSATCTAAVHSIPLKKFVDRSTPVRKGGPPRPVRYVVGVKSQRPSATPVIATVTIIVLLMAFLGQIYLESYGFTRPVLHAHKFMPAWTGARPLPQDPVASGWLFDLKAEHGDGIVVREEVVASGAGPRQIQIDAVHDEEVHGPARTWDDLQPKEKKAWREKLKAAGHWGEQMGESVFKGILFGEMAGAVGRAAAL